MLPALPYSCVVIFTVVPCRAQHVQHRCFCEEPSRQAWPSTSEPSSRVDNFWCVSVQATSSSTYHVNVIVVCNRTLLAFPRYFFILLHGSEDGRRAPTHLFSRLLPVLRYPLHQRRGSFLRVVLYDSVSLDPSRRRCTSGEDKTQGDVE